VIRYFSINLDGFVKSWIFPFIWIPAYSSLSLRERVRVRGNIIG
jgi:hypothetical protein